MEPLGVTATDDIDRLVALDADCVIYSPIMADPAVVARLLSSGKNVVTPLNWSFARGDGRPFQPGELPGLAPGLDRDGLERNPGIVATATHCVSAMPAVVGAEPGIRSYLDLPPYGGRAAPHLR